MRIAATILIALTLAGCESLSYYTQSVTGHLGVMAKRIRIASLLDDGTTSALLRTQLRTALELRSFATREMGLPDNNSYRSYADIGSSYVVWNVVATAELSLEPVTWCFPIVGCLAYRGYYSKSDAHEFAARLASDGRDVFVGGVRAYSTLGWFDDPLLNTMLEQPEYDLAAVIFHELSHQFVYVKDDTAFNESFAVAVEREGVRRWLAAHHDQGLITEYEESQRQEAVFVTMLLKTRQQLQIVYESEFSTATKRVHKQKIFDRLQEQVSRYRPTLAPGYLRWVSEDINNAKFALIATYHAKVRLFEQLLDAQDGDLEAFYAIVRELARMPREQREEKLTELAATR